MLRVDSRTKCGSEHCLLLIVAYAHPWTIARCVAFDWERLREASGDETGTEAGDAPLSLCDAGARADGSAATCGLGRVSRRRKPAELRSGRRVVYSGRCTPCARECEPFPVRRAPDSPDAPHSLDVCRAHLPPNAAAHLSECSRA